MNELKGIAEFIPDGEKKTESLRRNWRELTTEHGQIILDTHSAPEFIVNNETLKVGDAMNTIQSAITLGMNSDKSLKHLSNGLFVPANPTNTTIDAYVVLRLYLSDGKTKELRKNVRFVVPSERPNHEYHNGMKQFDRSETAGFVMFRCQSYPYRKKCRCYSSILMPIATMQRIEDHTFTTVKVQIQNETHRRQSH